jgi:hypothetical protein
LPDIGYYTLPVILSFKGIDAQVNNELGDKLKPGAKKAVRTPGNNSMNHWASQRKRGSGRPLKAPAEEFGKGVLDGINQGMKESVTGGRRENSGGRVRRRIPRRHRRTSVAVAG